MNGRKDPVVLRVETEGDLKDPLAVYAFDATGEPLAVAPVQDGTATLDVSDGALRTARLFVAPVVEGDGDRKAPTIAGLERIGAFEAAFGGRETALRVPADVAAAWRLCFCRVRGRVVTANGQPVCGARVHVCEVDPLPWWILRLPDPDVLRLRDDLLRALERIPIPEPEPDPFRLRSPLRFAGGLDRVALNPQPLPPRAVAAFDPQPDPPGVRGRLDSPILRRAFDPQPEPPAATRSPGPRNVRPTGAPADAGATGAAGALADVVTTAALRASSAALVRRGLLDRLDLVRPYLCLWPWWWRRFRCDEVRVIETDAAGRFSFTLLYPCNGDRPDLYFWVEYRIGGVWETVHRPPLPCHVHWDYACGSEVTVRVTDPRVPACGGEPDLGGLQVALLSIGNGVSMDELATSGLTSDGAPLGGRLEPHVWFSRTNLAAAGITKYRWTVRRLTGPDGTTPDVGPWTPLLRTVGRHYAAPTPSGDLAFPFEVLGPGADGLFRIPPVDLPAGGVEWVTLDAREDTASAFFETDALPHGLPESPPPSACARGFATAGRYELRLDLYRDDGTQVADWSAAGINLREADVAAPFGTGTVTTVAAPAHRRFLSGGATVAARIVVRVDNGCCGADLHPITGAGLTTDPNCGFVEYAPGAQATVAFAADHPRGFATFSFGTVRGAGTPVPDATTAGAVTAPSTPAGAGGAFNRTGSLFEKAIPVATLLTVNPPPPPAAPCDRAAFAETLYVNATATDGWGELDYLDASDVAAFALATPCDCG